MTELERLKWNIRPFISHKRASLPKTSVEKVDDGLLFYTYKPQMAKKLTSLAFIYILLHCWIKQFKEALLEGKYPNLESLKEMSKLGGAKESENTTPEVNVYNKAKSPLNKSDHIEDSNRGITGDTRRKEHEIAMKPPVENTLIDHVEHIISTSLEQNSDHANIEHGQQHPPSVDVGDDDDERIDIAAKKEAFLSSQCTLSQDFMSTVDFSEIFLCMKCSKGGQLLVCSSDACPFRVHESCLGSDAIFEESGAFFCPFCSYSHAISKYMEVKKKASIARKDLQVFLSSGVKHRQKTSSKTRACLDENTSIESGAMGEKVKLNGNEHAMSSGKDCAPADSLHAPTRQAGMTKQPSKEKESLVSSTYSPSRRTRNQEAQQ